MKLTNPARWGTLVALACGGLTLAAQDPGPSYDFKLRAGLTAGDLRKDHQDNKLMGVGAMATFPGFAGGALTAEVAFEYVPGRGYDAMRTTGPIYYNPASPATATNGQPLRLSLETSGDVRKEGMQGFSTRVGYSQPWSLMEGLSWHAGLTLDAYKVASEYTQTLIPVYGAGNGTKVPPVDGNKEYYEGAAFQVKGSKITPGLYVGAALKVSANHRVEVNLRNLGYLHREYTPFTYSGKAASLEEKMRRGWALELGLAMKI